MGEFGCRAVAALPTCAPIVNRLKERGLATRAQDGILPHRQTDPLLKCQKQYGLCTSTRSFVLMGQQMLAGTRNEIAEAKEQKESIEKKLKGFEPERLDMDALDDWENGTFPWMDKVPTTAPTSPTTRPDFA